MSATVVDRDSALTFLLGMVNYERTSAIPYRTHVFKLDRMRRLLEILGNPQLKVPAIHIAGTKGKGSTAAMLASCLQKAGYTTGLYTSPHLLRLEERFRIDGQDISAEQLVKYSKQLEAALPQLQQHTPADESPLPTFFELTTALMFLYFAEVQVDVAVLEVGLGGRLDSTNVCQPEVSIITSISFDHTKQLGNTLAAIAGEKAGIIKPGVPVVSGEQKAEPAAVIAETAHTNGAQLYQLGTEFQLETVPGSSAFNYRAAASLKHELLEHLQLSMPGEHQKANAAVAICALQLLRDKGWSISATAIREGLAEATVAGRIEVLSASPPLVLDVAHNVASIEALLRTLHDLFPGSPRVLVVAASKDKDVAGMLARLVPACDHLVLTQYLNNPRAASLQELYSLATTIRSGNTPTIHTAHSPAVALALARTLQQQTPNSVLCITGSIFLAAEMQELLQPEVVH